MDLPTQENIDFVRTLTTLIATQGVFAFAALFLYRFMFRPPRAKDGDPPPKRLHWKDLGVQDKIVAVMTVVLTLAASGVWFYAVYVHSPMHMVSGTVRDLRDNPVDPALDVDHVVERIEPLSLSQTFLTAKRLRVDEGLFDLHWIITSQREIETVRLRLHRYYEEWNRPGTLGAGPFIRSGHPVFELAIPLDSVQSSGNRPLELFLVPDPEGPESPGLVRILRGNGDEDLVIPLQLWTAVAMGHEAGGRGQGLAGRLKNFLLNPLVAWQSIPRPSSERYARALQSPDPGERLAAVDALLERGVDGAVVVESILASASTVDRGGRSLLLHSLSEVLAGIEAKTGESWPDLHLGLARAFSGIHDLSAAAREFERVGSAMELSPSDHYDRATAFQGVEKHTESVVDFQAYLQAQEPPAAADRASALAQQGYSLFVIGRQVEAQERFDQAVQTLSGFAPALNASAFLRAESGQDLARALDYANQALEEEPENPDYLDTLGWVLCKLQRPDSAEAVLSRALRMRPGDSIFAEHLTAVRMGACGRG